MALFSEEQLKKSSEMLEREEENKFLETATEEEIFIFRAKKAGFTEDQAEFLYVQLNLSR